MVLGTPVKHGLAYYMRLLLAPFLFYMCLSRELVCGCRWAVKMTLDFALPLLLVRDGLFGTY